MNSIIIIDLWFASTGLSFKRDTPIYETVKWPGVTFRNGYDVEILFVSKSLRRRNPCDVQHNISLRVYEKALSVETLYKLIR